MEADPSPDDAISARRPGEPATPEYLPITRPPKTPHRAFSSDCEILADEWSKQAISPMPWIMDPSPAANQGIEGGFWVSAAPYRAYAKPLRLTDLYNRQTVEPSARPIAAIEKIASDLAFVLGLPIPPVTLWERDTPPLLETRYHAISAVPFPGAERWELLQQNTNLAKLVLPHCPPAMSAMSVFDTWVECYDHRDHGGNLLFSMSSAGLPHLAFIDYSFSMLHGWRTNGYRDIDLVPPYVSGCEIIPDGCAEIVAAIEGVSDETIRSIVMRIPENFLTKLDGALIMEGLQFRRDGLRSAISRLITE